MSNEISNSDLFNVMMSVKGDIGRLDTKADVAAQLLAQHDSRVSALEAGANRQKGAARVVLMLGTALGTVGGVVATWLTSGKH